MRQPPGEEWSNGFTDDWSSAKPFLPHRTETRLALENTCKERKVCLGEDGGDAPWRPVGRPDLHRVVFAVWAVLQVQVHQSDGDDVALSGTSAPVQTGVRQVSVGVPRRLHPSQQHGGGQGGGQEEKKTEVKMQIKIKRSGRCLNALK